MNIEQLREFCLSLPGVTEDIKWGADLCFLVGDKMFCVTSLDAPHAISLKVRDDEYDELVHNSNIIPAPYLARYKWVQAGGWNCFTDEEWEKYLLQSYALIKAKLPKSKLKML